MPPTGKARGGLKSRAGRGGLSLERQGQPGLEVHELLDKQGNEGHTFLRTVLQGQAGSRYLSPGPRVLQTWWVSSCWSPSRGGAASLARMRGCAEVYSAARALTSRTIKATEAQPTAEESVGHQVSLGLAAGPAAQPL